MSGDRILDAFRETWEPYKRPVDLSAVDTDSLRVGWPKPTIYREHETIHVLANAIDQARADLAAAQTREAKVRALCERADTSAIRLLLAADEVHRQGWVRTTDLRSALDGTDSGTG